MKNSYIFKVLMYNTTEGNLENFIQAIQNWFGRLSAKQKQILILACTGLFALLLTISVILSISGKKEEIPAGPADIMIISPIPAGEIFLPDEPDFIPGVLLERYRKASWTEEDALEHWQDPLRFGEEQWRVKIETTIDNFLENIP